MPTITFYMPDLWEEGPMLKVLVRYPNDVMDLPGIQMVSPRLWENTSGTDTAWTRYFA